MSDRIPDQRYAEVITRAKAYIPTGIRRRLDGVRFVCGVDPLFAGLHTFDVNEGRAAGKTAHIVWDFLLPRPASDRQTTIVLPYVPRVETVVHELGHALHGAIGFDHDAVPVTAYARTDRFEAFAESFTAWTFGHGWYGDEKALMGDGATLALFASL